MCVIKTAVGNHEYLFEGVDPEIATIEVLSSPNDGYAETYSEFTATAAQMNSHYQFTDDALSDCRARLMLNKTPIITGHCAQLANIRLSDKHLTIQHQTRVTAGNDKCGF